jgi:hypothetical protein
MKNLIYLFLGVFLFNLVTYAGDGKKYGNNLTLKEKTKISQILNNPSEYIGKKVLVEGVIIDVCPKRGCWLEVASDEEFQKIKIKVNDGEIIFPMEARGKNVLVEGEVYEIKMTKEQAIARAEHEAEEKGIKFDPSTVTGPETIYQIKGLGAVIK